MLKMDLVRMFRSAIENDLASRNAVHMSTAGQIPRTLNRFFAASPSVGLVKCAYKRINTWKKVKWESTAHGECFPHLYGLLTGDVVEVRKQYTRNIYR